MPGLKRITILQTVISELSVSDAVKEVYFFLIVVFYSSKYKTPLNTPRY